MTFKILIAAILFFSSFTGRSALASEAQCLALFGGNTDSGIVAYPTWVQLDDDTTLREALWNANPPADVTGERTYKSNGAALVVNRKRNDGHFTDFGASVHLQKWNGSRIVKIALPLKMIEQVKGFYYDDQRNEFIVITLDIGYGGGEVVFKAYILTEETRDTPGSIMLTQTPYLKMPANPNGVPVNIGNLPNSNDVIVKSGYGNFVLTTGPGYFGRAVGNKILHRTF